VVGVSLAYAMRAPIFVECAIPSKLLAWPLHERGVRGVLSAPHKRLTSTAKPSQDTANGLILRPF
jgi:hypothetical protein